MASQNSSSSPRSRVLPSSSPVHPPQLSSSPRSSSRIRSSGRNSSPQMVQPTSSPSHRDTSTRGNRLEMVSMHQQPSDEHQSSQQAQMLIWGTDVNLADTQQRCRNFFTYFEADSQAKYIEMLRERLNEGVGSSKQTFNINMHDVHTFDASLYNDIITYPVELMQIMDMVFNDICDKECAEQHLTESPNCECRVYNLLQHKSLREIDPTQIDTLVSIRGMIIRASNIIPDLQTAFFQCGNCEAHVEVALDKGKIAEPTACEACNAPHMMSLIHNRCRFKDKQMVRLQEAPGSVPDGETPQTITLIAHEDLVDAVRMGDRIEVTGVYRACSLRARPTARTLKSVFKTYIDVLHYRPYKGKLTVDTALGPVAAEDSVSQTNNISQWMTDEDQMTKDQKLAREEKMKEIANDPNIYEKLLKSFAPGIHEQDDVKLGILAQLFGGSNVLSTDAPQGRFRGELNVLLIGDPGVAKSQLLQYVHKIAPRGIYTSGKGSSSVGLTAYVTKDPETREIVLESGALVLSDQGICCIDEFDKMTDSTRSILHEVMEQQTISIAKAGIVCSLNARTSILAAANPIHSRYNPTMSVVDNLNLPPSLLSRFDLIYLMLDKPNPYSDRRLAKHIVSMFFEVPLTETVAEDTLDVASMTQYIAYCRSQPPPTLTDEAAHELCESYVKMRNSGAGRKTITATPRQLESVIRLAEARAKMRLSPVVTVDDVQEGVRLMKVATQSAATDPVTGLIDMEIISTGRSSSARQRLKDVAQRIEQFMTEKQEALVRMSSVLEHLNKDIPDKFPDRLITLRDAREAIELLIVDDRVKRSGGEGRDEAFYIVAPYA